MKHKEKNIKENISILALDNDEITNGVTTFTNGLGDKFLFIAMPTNFKKWKSVVISFENHVKN